MIAVLLSNGTYAVALDGRPIGTVRTYHHAFHATYLYVEPQLSMLDAADSRALFDRIRADAGRGLQAMCSSADTVLGALLTAGGFLGKRRCYESEVGSADRIGVARAPQAPRCCKAGCDDYTEAARLQFVYYAETHRHVSPLTADFASFTECLPRQAYIEKTADRVTQTAFTEESEIAYVASAEPAAFETFIGGVADALLDSYPQITFESDDCDAAAMTLRGLFRSKSGDSFDTYIRE